MGEGAAYTAIAMKEAIKDANLNDDLISNVNTGLIAGSGGPSTANLLKAFGFYQRTYFQYKGHAGGKWAADAYLASARCLDILGLENDKRNTFRAMLFDPFVNKLEQANVAREILGQTE